MNIKRIEHKALVTGVIISMIMAISGWVTYYFTNSEAVLLDGNFSFILAMSTLTAVIISNNKHRKTSTFPFGSYAYESFFTLFKGVFILGVTSAALIQNTIKIINYIDGHQIAPLSSLPILYYSAIMTVLCFGMALYYKTQNKKINQQSAILSVEVKSSVVDGFISMGIGIALVGTSMIRTGSAFDFLLYIGDAVIVIILCLLLFKTPLKIIKESFIELGGGILQDKDSRAIIEEIINDHISPEFQQSSNYITKLGSFYLVVLYLKVKKDRVSLKKIEELKEKMLKSLSKRFKTVNLEIILRPDDTDNKLNPI